MPCVMNAANEAAVKAFLSGQIGFYDITNVVSECMATAEHIATPDIEAIYEVNDKTYKAAEDIIKRIS